MYRKYIRYFTDIVDWYVITGGYKIQKHLQNFVFRREIVGTK